MKERHEVGRVEVRLGRGVSIGRRRVVGEGQKTRRRIENK
jgi:hypothetical protein